jgi:hypothetical protein
MARPAGRPIAVRAVTIHDLREEFLARCTAKNLSGWTLEWYEDRTRRFNRQAPVARRARRRAATTGRR